MAIYQVETLPDINQQSIKKVNWDHWNNLSRYFLEPVAPMEKVRKTKIYPWETKVKKALTEFRALAKSRGMTFKKTDQGGFAFFDRKTGEMLGKSASIKQHVEYLPKYYIESDDHVHF